MILTKRRALYGILTFFPLVTNTIVLMWDLLMKDAMYGIYSSPLGNFFANVFSPFFGLVGLIAYVLFVLTFIDRQTTFRQFARAWLPWGILLFVLPALLTLVNVWITGGNDLALLFVPYILVASASVPFLIFGLYTFITRPQLPESGKRPKRYIVYIICFSAIISLIYREISRSNDWIWIFFILLFVILLLYWIAAGLKRRLNPSN